ncbi:hypothetical protein CEE37_14055 [candidate division LCP-89 bacterium B3_LCP]|uniref:Secretion system C-terminal sorting domain-containing protein n=1 Tax=candidate division LCP-89 bacterium B3_LCP TaxID=2012998 RepID=A0A532UQR1_UNCL8|nr:MAG: hypothetical protein CEE37_14055 [candidate division LCP-89 bacterium B3_LCP]
MLEMPAMEPAWNLLPYPTLEQYKTSLLWMQDWLNREGITTAHDAWMEFDPNYYGAYDELAEEGNLTVRYRGSWYIDPALNYMADIQFGLWLSEGFNHPHFKMHSFKFLADNAIEGETALLLEPYAHRPDYYGIKNWEDADMVNAFAMVDEAGHQIHVHVIGDSAAKYTLDALERVGVSGNRHSLAHLQLARSEDVIRMGELGISAHMSQYWMVIDEYYWNFYLPYLGPDRANDMYPHQSLFDADVNVTVGSDFYTSEPDLMKAIYNGMERSNVGGLQLPPARECVSLEEMLRAATINGAYANFLEDEIGSIEVGKKADIVVLSDNLFEITTEEIPNVEIEMTFFEGNLVYDQSSSTPVFDQNSSGIINPTCAPTSITLIQNYPNPFNPITTISFFLPFANSVKVEVFDISGSRVGVGLAPTRQYPPGTHQITFDGSGLPSGIYIYRIQAGDFSATEKMVLVK